MRKTIDNILGNSGTSATSGKSQIGQTGTQAANATQQGTTTATPTAVATPQATSSQQATQAATNTASPSASQAPVVNNGMAQTSTPTPPSRQSLVSQMTSEKRNERVPNVDGGGTASGMPLTREQIFRMYNKDPMLTPGEEEKERKKQKREQLFAAIGDGISALSNLYFTTQYAPNMYAPMKTQSARVRKRWEKLAAERNANMKAYSEGLANAIRADQEWQRMIGLDKAKQERDRLAAEQEKMKLKAQEAKDKAAADMAERRQKEEERHNRATEAAANERNRISRAKGGGSGGGSGRGSKKNSADMDAAYRYWMSLNDNEKNQYRDQNKRGQRVKTGTKGTGALKEDVYGTKYMDDDDDFILQVWRQRKAYLRNHGRGDEIASGGFNLNSGFNVNDYKRTGNGKKGNSAPPLN